METLTPNCMHSYSFGGMCFVCGKDLEETDVSLRCIHQSHQLKETDVRPLNINRMWKSDMESHRKLYLVLDLDHTLLNSTRINDFTTDEYYLKTLSSLERERLLLFTVESIRYITKLRPFVRTFLKEASEMFELCIYTMGSRHYAREMAKLLDPEGVYFGDRIISRDDSTVDYKKNLDVVLVNKEAVLIVDDLKHVWSKKLQRNLIEIQRYEFFGSSSNGLTPLSEMKMDESESDGALSNVLNVLKQTHCLFFEDNSRDVRSVLKQVQNEAKPGNLKWIHLFNNQLQRGDKTSKETPAEDETSGTREEAGWVSPQQHLTKNKAVTKLSNNKAINKILVDFVYLLRKQSTRF